MRGSSFETEYFVQAGTTSVPTIHRWIMENDGRESIVTRQHFPSMGRMPLPESPDAAQPLPLFVTLHVRELLHKLGLFDTRILCGFIVDGREKGFHC